jgi:DNA-binding SARP family transcriptional activator
VLLTQAVRENALAPRGFDLVVDGAGLDGSPQGFLERLAHAGRAAEMSSPGAFDPDRALNELADRWPQGVCIVVDDVHDVASSREAQELLAHLVTHAPPSVHFLLAGREPVRGIGRLRAADEVVDVDETDLAFDDDENAAVASLLGAAPEPLTATGGWPAYTSIRGLYGRAAADGYASDEVLAPLRGEELRAFAIAAAIGRCDANVLAHTVDDSRVDVAQLMAGIPMTRVRDSDEYAVHELWRRIIPAVDDGDVRRAVARAIRFHAARGDDVRAFDLAAAHACWDEAERVVTASCNRGHIDVPARVVTRWLDALPRSRCDEPDGLLLRGVRGRMLDPFGSETAHLLQRAVDGYRNLGNVGGEIAAASELAYVLRNQGRCDGLLGLLGRAAEMHAGGHREADGWMAIARSAIAELAGDDAQMVAELDAVTADAFGRPWRAFVEFRRAIGHLALGHERDAIEAATAAATLADGNTVRHVLPLVQWFAGDPTPALAACDEIAADATRSRVDGVALGAFASMLLASAGRVDEATERLAATEAASNGPLPARMRGYLIGVRALLAAARGDDDSARDILAAALDAHPITTPVGRQTASYWLALAYVLVPEVRPELDSRDDLGEIHRRRIEVARAVAAAREGRPLLPHITAGLRPDLIATTVPLPWASTLAATLADSPAGRALTEMLFALHGEPARSALREVAQRPGTVRGAGKLLAAVALAPRREVRLSVLGPTMLSVGGQPCTDVDWQRERVRSLLTFLALKRHARRSEIIDALWPDLDFDAADRNLRVTLTYLHRVIEPERQRGEASFLLRQSGSALMLVETPHFSVDVHEFEELVRDAEDAERRGAASDARGYLERAVALWGGSCLADAAHEEWALSACRRLTDLFVRAAVRAAELNLAARNTWRARQLAERALEQDSWSEAAHRVLIGAALADGDHAGTIRALDACEDMLAELGVDLAPETSMLRHRIQSPASPRAVSASA